MIRIATITTLLFSMMSSHTVFSQNQDVQHIRDVYQEVNNQIKECKTAEEAGEPCGFYNSKIVINANNQPWRAVGNYKKHESYWHTDDPGMADMMEVNPASMLSKVSSQTNSTYELYEEYLFEDGQLIFYYYSYNYGDEGKEEYRFYFKDQQLISFVKKNETEDEDTYSKEDAEKILKLADKKIQTFINMF